MAAESDGLNDSLVPPFVEINIEDIEFYEKCGGGAFGSVYRAKWTTSNRIVAVKKLLYLEKEAQVLSVLSHKNIITFFGAVTKAPNFCLVTEYAENDCLYSYLSYLTSQNQMLGFEEILHWSFEIASGMHYLHSEAPVKVIHRDLKSKNVVITSDFVCKICDFGASTFSSGTTRMSMAGTLPWMAPEVIQSLPVSESCDVWSFGVVLWEILTHEIPFKGIEGYQVAWAVVEKDERLPIPKRCPPKFARLMASCWQTNPKERPNFALVRTILMAMQDDESLFDEASIYLSQKNVWRKEIESTLELMKRAESDLSQKQKQLEEWECELRKKEQRLSDYKLSQDLLKEDINQWTDQDVSVWLNQVATQESQIEAYINLFLEQHINGRCLLMLTSDLLKDLGVNSLGHRMNIMNEIEKLRAIQHKRQHFPPLEEAVTITASQQSRSVRITLIFGIHLSRPGSEVTKWKMFLEVDPEENPLVSITSIKDVSFECQQADLPLTRISTPPFVMDRWCIGIGDQPVVTCIVTYEDSIIKPRFTRYFYNVSLDGTVQTKEVYLTMRNPIIMPSQQKKPVSLIEETKTGSLPRSWQKRFNPTLFSYPETKPRTPGLWAQIVAGTSAHFLNTNASSSEDSIFDTVLPKDMKNSFFKKKHKKSSKHNLLNFNDSSSSDSQQDRNPFRRGSAPNHHKHNFHKYKHSTSDTGFFEAPSPPVIAENGSETSQKQQHFKYQKCHIKVKDHLQHSRRRPKSVSDPIDLVTEKLEDLTTGFTTKGSRGSHHRGRSLFHNSRNEPLLKRWALNTEFL